MSDASSERRHVGQASLNKARPSFVQLSTSRFTSTPSKNSKIPVGFFQLERKGDRGKYPILLEKAGKEMQGITKI